MLAPPKRRERVFEPHAAAVEPRLRARDLEAIRRPAQRALQLGESHPVDVRLGACEIAVQIVAALEEMEDADEVPVACNTPGLLREENLLHPGKVHAGRHVPRHFGEVRQFHGTGEVGFRAVRQQIQAAEPHDAAVDGEPALHVGAHRLVLLNRDRAVREPRGAAVPPGLRNDDLEVAGDDQERSFVIVVGELAAVRQHVRHRRREAFRAARLVAVARELREAVAIAGPLLDEHVPVVHDDRVHQHFAMQQRGERHRDVDRLRRQERAIALLRALRSGGSRRRRSR